MHIYIQKYGLQKTKHFPEICCSINLFIGLKKIPIFTFFEA